MSVTVKALSITPVKGTRLQRRGSAFGSTRRGVRENRRFFLIDEKDEMVNGKSLGALNSIVSGYSDPDRRLTLTFPDGRALEDEVSLGDELVTRFFGRADAGSAGPGAVVGGDQRVRGPAATASSRRGLTGPSTAGPRAR